jgi:hypothetical protein
MLKDVQRCWQPELMLTKLSKLIQCSDQLFAWELKEEPMI